MQAIEFLAHLYEKGCHGPFLIVAPASTLGEYYSLTSHSTLQDLTMHEVRVDVYASDH